MKDKKILSSSENSNSKFEEFLEDFQEYERDKAENAFLDAYSRWLKTKALKDKLEAMKKGIKFEALNSQFSLAFIFPLK
ncbi:MAG: hypothetical protein P9L98_02075 [Candidatus Kaelpia imicola]|nr:hypothetical protein [Candidatus Kaelpia imicola]